MVVNVYLSPKGELIHTLVDESTSHLLGDFITLKGKHMVITNLVKSENFDYATIVNINTVVDDNDDTVDRVIVGEEDIANGNT